MARTLLGIVSLLCTSCVVQRPGPDFVWTCERDDECIEGFRCWVARADAPGRCHPGCDVEGAPSCSGVCTADGLCWERCEPAAEQCSADLACLGPRGVADSFCYPDYSPCTTSLDCDAEHVCLSEVLPIDSSRALSLPIPPRGAEYCLPKPSRNGGTWRCPQGFVLDLFGFGMSLSARCLPRCERNSCPPGMTCLRELGSLLSVPGANADLCMVGGLGMPCSDSTDCLVGRCLPVGGGRKACTLDCDEARMLPEGCSSLERTVPVQWEDRWSVRCESVEGRRVCVPRAQLGAPCNRDMLCDERFECRSFGIVGTSESVFSICTALCEADLDCRFEGQPSAYCASDRSCQPTFLPLTPCSRDAQCGGSYRCLECNGNRALCLLNCGPEESP